MMSRRASCACLASLLILAACASSRPTPSEIAQPLPSATPDDCPGQHEAPQLEQLLPDEFAGADLCRISVGHTDSLDELGDQLYAGAIYGRVIVTAIPGAELADFSMAQATDDNRVVLIATRVAGATPGELIGAFSHMHRVATQTNLGVIGGVEVIEARIDDEPDEVTYGWVRDGLLFESVVSRAELEQLVAAGAATLDE